MDDIRDMEDREHVISSVAKISHDRNLLIICVSDTGQSECLFEQLYLVLPFSTDKLQWRFNGSNIFGTMEIRSRHG